MNENQSPEIKFTPFAPLAERVLDAVGQVLDMLDRLTYNGCYGKTEEGFRKWQAEQRELENE